VVTSALFRAESEVVMMRQRAAIQPVSVSGKRESGRERRRSAAAAARADERALAGVL
jgi:hypothetical protein